MAKKFLTSIDLGKKELLNPVLHNLATLPAASASIAGLCAFHTGTGKNYPVYFNGTEWKQFGWYIEDGTTAQYLRGDKSWQTLNTTVVIEGTKKYFTEARVLASKLLKDPYSPDGAIAKNDELEVALWKLQAQLNLFGNSGYATTSYVDTAISNLVNGAGSALDTLNELAEALGNDPNFATTVSTQLAGKEPKITAGTPLQYWRGDKSWQTLSTSVVPESGDRKYFNEARVLATKTTPGSVIGAWAPNDSLDTVLKKFSAQINNKLDATATAVAAAKLNPGANIFIAGSTGLSATGLNFDGTRSIGLQLAGILKTANGGTGRATSNRIVEKWSANIPVGSTTYLIEFGGSGNTELPISQVINTQMEIVECDISYPITNGTRFVKLDFPTATTELLRCIIMW